MKTFKSARKRHEQYPDDDDEDDDDDDNADVPRIQIEKLILDFFLPSVDFCLLTSLYLV